MTTETSAGDVPALNRRAVLVGGCAACAAVLSACSGYGSGRPAAQPPPAAPAGGALVATANVPVGGGVVLAEQDVVVTQPAAGEFKGFSATCTHQGCKVGEVSGGTINCPCHGSKFTIADGAVADGPAPSPLPERAIAVAGNEITLA
jgi:nitrite reductase/ring-hydroxylating ferredoxin subunit